MITAAAFSAGKPVHISNTSVVVDKSTGAVRCYLHGNLIAERVGDVTRFQSCGWETQTTRARLNACGCPCRIKDFQLINDVTGEPIPERW